MRWKWLWAGWALLFFVIELPAAFNDSDGDTLSELVWRLLERNSLWTFALIAGLLWVGFHLVWEGRSRRKKKTPDD